MESQLSLDIYVNIPSWVGQLSESQQGELRYRVYIDDELITERTWIWGDSVYLKEIIWVDIEPGQHCLKIEPILPNPAQARFSIDNFRTNGIIESIKKDLEISFKI
jgi:hypothetical protein